MAKASPIIAALNGGEWSPFLDGRVDIDGYSASAYRCFNFIPTIQGPVTRRAGTGHVRQVKDTTAKTRLVPFVKARDDAVMIEFGNLYCRFYVNRSAVVTGSPVTITGATQADPVVVTAAAHGYSNGQDVFISGVAGMTQINSRWFRVANAAANTFELTTIHGDNVDGTGFGAYTSGGAVDKPYEIVSPYSTSVLTNSRGELGIDIAQSGDVLYIADRAGAIAPQKLSRSGAVSWAFSELQPDGGPFEAVNAGATTMYASAATGSGITITASASVFTAADVGRLVRLDQNIITATQPWKASKSYSSGDYVRSEGKEYKATSTATSGTTIPDHTSGTVSDGGVNWQYISAGYGIARITAQAGTSATADVVVDFPQTLVGSGNASVLWRVGSWGIGTYPTCVTFYRERLAFGNLLRLDLSVAGSYENFSVDVAGEVLPESAISIDMPGPANNIVGLQEGTVLSALTEGGEFAVGPASTSNPFGPNNVEASGQTAYGARPITPVRVGKSVLFVQASAKRLRAMAYDWQSEAFTAADMTIRADHIAGSGIARLARQESPYGAIWGLRTDGYLLSFTYDPDQSARAWARHQVGTVEDVAVIPSPDGTRDEVWLVSNRTINGAVRRYIEYIRPEFQEGDAIEDATYCDSGLTYDGAAATTLYGFDHLEGEDVALMIDGDSAPAVTVAAGVVTLPYAGEVVQVGLSYASQYASNRLEAGAADGTAQTKTKRITDVSYRVWNTLGGSGGHTAEDADQIPDLTYRAPSVLMGSGPALVTGDVNVSWTGGYETAARLWYVNDSVFPATVVAMVPQVVVQDSR